MREARANVLHGIMLMALFSFSAFYIADLPLIKQMSLSPLIVGIIIGMIYANTLRMHLPETWTQGIVFCSKTLLRGAIVFYGFRLTLQNIVNVGTAGIVVDLIIVISVILLGLLIGKLLRLDPNLTILIASGSAICGAAAVLGTESVLPDSKPHQTAVAVSTVVIFGTIAMFLYPSLYRAGIIDFEPKSMGVYTGSTLHEVAHVVGAGNAMNNAVIANTSIIVKMTRVILLVPFLLILSLFVNTKKGNSHDDKKSKIAVPWFAFGFLGVICINSLLQSYNLMPSNLNGGINTIVDFALTMAMTALGSESNFEKFKKAGLKPFLMAFILFVWLFSAGYIAVNILPKVS